jgi:LysW-gamma-L-lysine carboxypeptidase
MQALNYSRAFIDKAGNAVGVMGEGDRQIVLLGHIDTVPGKIPVRLDGDSLYARGSVDAKGPLAAFVDAVSQVGAQPGWQMVVIGALDEERESLGARYIRSKYKPKYAIIGEPSRWDRCTLGYKGSARATAVFHQSQAHSAGKQSSAPEKAIQSWNAVSAWVEGFNHDRQRMFDQLQVSLRAFSSREGNFEAWAHLEIAARLPLNITAKDWYQQLQTLCTPGEVTPSGYSIPAYRAEKNTSLVRAFLAGIRDGGGKPGFVLKTGTADLNIVAPAWGCPALAYGPGDSALDHTPNEHISLEEYHRAVGVLETVLLKLTHI